MQNGDISKLNKKIKRYRIFSVIAVIAFFVIGVCFNSIVHKEHVPDSDLALLDPLREFMPQENYITNIQDLRVYIHSIGAQYPENVSIYYENINTGSNISVGKELRLFPASLSKLVQAILIVKKVEDGELKWNQVLKAAPGDVSADSGELYKTIGDSGATVEQLLKELLVNSDNTAQNIFRRQLDVPDYIKFQENTGLEDLYNEKGLISAKEYTRILRVLYTSNFLKPENSEKILEYMADAKFKDYLSQGIPDGVKFAHKYGENKEYSIFADSGIVYVPGKPYMLTVIIKGKDSNTETQEWAKKLMKEISEHAYIVSK